MGAMPMQMLSIFLRTFRQLVEHPEEDVERPTSRYLPKPTDEFWGEDRSVSPSVIGEEDQRQDR